MKLIKYLLLLTGIIFSQQNRYTDSLFLSNQVVIDGVYAESPQLISPYQGENSTNTVQLKFHLFEPQNDNLAERPLILCAHGGGFFSGNKEHDDMMEFCRVFSTRGYLTATIQYRLGMNVTSSVSATRAVYRGVQDGRAAVSFFKANANQFGIDTNRVYFIGSSAGAFIGLHNIFMNEESERPEESYEISHFPPTLDDGPDLGSLSEFEINSNISPHPNAVFSLWGALKDTNLIKSQDLINDVFLVHGTADDIVPFNIGSPFNLNSFPPTYGSLPISQALDNFDCNFEEYFVEGEGHEFYGVLNGMWNPAPNQYWDSVLTKATNYFWSKHKPVAAFEVFYPYDDSLVFHDLSIDAISWNWDFGDGTTSEEQNPSHLFDVGEYRVLLTIQNEIESWDTVSQLVNIISSGTEEENLPIKFELSQNYPNPFSAKSANGETSTTIKFSIPNVFARSETTKQSDEIATQPSVARNDNVRLIVYNALGQQVAELINKPLTAGNYEVEFRGNNLPSGIYFYRLQSGDFVDVKKMILLK